MALQAIEVDIDHLRFNSENAPSPCFACVIPRDRSAAVQLRAFDKCKAQLVACPNMPPFLRERMLQTPGVVERALFSFSFFQEERYWLRVGLEAAEAVNAAIFNAFRKKSSLN